jgi:hypothetical protein
MKKCICDVYSHFKPIFFKKEVNIVSRIVTMLRCCRCYHGIIDNSLLIRTPLVGYSSCTASSLSQHRLQQQSTFISPAVRTQSPSLSSLSVAAQLPSSFSFLSLSQWRTAQKIMPICIWCKKLAPKTRVATIARS